MQASHAYRRHHSLDSGLMQMILINNGDVENLSFARGPVALNADDGLAGIGIVLGFGGEGAVLRRRRLVRWIMRMHWRFLMVN
ncbi:hypothetical protein LguiA_025563 [Lonicera macranthoides]